MKNTKPFKSRVKLAALKKAKKEGLLHVGKHYAGEDTRCDHCGKTNPTQAIAACRNMEEKTADYQAEGPLWLNSDAAYLVGSTCLKVIIKKLS